MADPFRSMRKPHGAFLDEGGREVADTLCCPHCNAHFFITKGSGRIRGFCLSCMNVTCGGPSCSKGCTPFLKRLEEFEKGRTTSLF